MNTPAHITTYSVQRVWVLKNMLYMAPVFLVLLLVGGLSEDGNFILLFYIIFLAFFYSIINGVRLSYFSYNLDDKFLNVKQGIIRRQEVHIPYGRIQEISVRRDLADRVLGLSALSVLNAAQSGKMVDEYGNTTRIVRGMRLSRNRSRMEMIGFKGNMVHIPGLLPKDAEALKMALLQKMKEHEGEEMGL